MAHEQKTYLTVTIERRGYGRRYTWLPVDTLSREGFSIDFDGSYTRPAMIDIQQGDSVFWQDGGRRVEGIVSEVERGELSLRVAVVDVRPLPPEVFVP
ncbi:MAG TPA: hypothetical protein VFT66_08780 [Roseiflexaceae bacterium]|jgi:hypothetical protein|nr:hypothetical protein [Roseiflexaceae bacterium]